MNWKYAALALVGSSLLVQLPALSLQFPPTGGTGAPERTASGGRRGDFCIQAGALPATALVPKNNLGTTVSETPTLFFYIPQSETKTAEFVLMDNERNEIFQTKITLPGKPGVMKLDVPSTVKLEENKTYWWEFSIICNTQDRSGDRYIQGMLQRTPLSPELKTKLEAAKPLQQAELLAQAKIWQESLAIAAQLRGTNPKAWEELLKSVGLSAIASQPFAN
ncbi:DUF928 domain-containing protein [Allocoleopsis sp.]|uniref:DUF928 domain-containing protein n=1 Tax=Allocoleopsis sp. TaxID=3088169 RepID=UPI002FCEBEBB